MKKLRRRLGSALLIVAMLLSMFPSSAFAAWEDNYRYYYFYNSTDTSLGEDVKVYYSTDGRTLNPLAHDQRTRVSKAAVESGSVDAIVFYVYINEASASDAGISFTTPNQLGQLNTIDDKGTIKNSSGETVGQTFNDTNFLTATQAALSKGCTYEFHYSQFDWNSHGGYNNFRGFKVWMNYPEVIE